MTGAKFYHSHRRSLSLAASSAASVFRVLLRRTTALLLLGMMLAVPVSKANAVTWPPTAFDARFTLSSGGIKLGESSWSVTRPSATKLHYATRTEPVVPYSWLRPDIVEESTVVSLENGLFRPTHYSYARTGGKRDRVAQVAFDWPASIAISQAKGTSATLVLPANALDKLSYLLVAMRDIARGDKTLHYEVVAGLEIETYQLHVKDTVELQTTFGPLLAFRVERIGQKNRHTVLWMAPSLGHLPVRIEHTEKDDSTVTLELMEVSGIN
jgi:hypothetical protein